VVATGTGLSLEDVKAEQRLRRNPPPFVPAASVPLATDPFAMPGSNET
jgi:hypothetical protein